MGSSPSATWEPDFDFYEARIDDARVILALDLAAIRVAPLGSHPHRLQIRIRMLQPRDDGLRSSEEAPALFALEDRIAGVLADEHGAIQVGRVLHAGYSIFVFYVGLVASERCHENLPAIIGDTAPYRLEWLTEEDADWSYYREFLWPNPYALQSIHNRRLMDVREKHRDCPEIVREVDHFAYFPDEARTRKAMRLLAAAGFRVDEPGRRDTDVERPWGVQFHRDDRLDARRPDEIVTEILDVILPLDGEYDGWGAVIERRDA
jgi:hypothetical protein